MAPTTIDGYNHALMDTVMLGWLPQENQFLESMGIPRTWADITPVIYGFPYGWHRQGAQKPVVRVDNRCVSCSGQVPVSGSAVAEDLLR